MSAETPSSKLPIKRDISLQHFPTPFDGLDEKEEAEVGKEYCGEATEGGEPSSERPGDEILIGHTCHYIYDVKVSGLLSSEQYATSEGDLYIIFL